MSNTEKVYWQLMSAIAYRCADKFRQRSQNYRAACWQKKAAKLSAKAREV